MISLTTRERLEQALHDHGCKQERRGEWTCPAHQDKRASMSVSDGRDGRVLVHCHAGCTPAAIVTAIGLQLADLQPDHGGSNGNGNGTHRLTIQEAYDYVDEDGQFLFQVCRLVPKDFRQRRRDPSTPDGWTWKTKGTRKVLYRLPNVIQAVREGRRVWIVEGEKDVHALERAGEVATCNPGGAGKWLKEFGTHLVGAHILIVQDRDTPGVKHAQQVKDQLVGFAASIRIMEAAAGKDAADHLGEGYPVDAFTEVQDTPAPDRITHYRSGLEVFDAAPEHPAWLWHGYLAQGAVTLLAGRHKGGKSTLLFGLIRAFVDGHTRFLNHDVEPGPVVLLTEEAPGTLRPKMEAITRTGMERLRILCRDDITPVRPSWEDSVREAGMEALEHGAKLVVIDTFAFWSQITDENDSAVMQNAVAVLAELTAKGLSVIVVHHHRKGAASESGDAIRGSTALQGAVDLIVELFRVDDDEAITTQRELRAIGRYPEIPEVMRVQLEGDGVYRVVAEGSREQVTEHTWKERVCAYLMDNHESKHTQAEIRNTLAPENPEKAKGRVHKALTDLVNEGLIQKIGDGNKQGYRWITH